MSSNRPVITTSKLTTTVVANGSKPGDNSIPMVEVNKNEEEEEPLMVDGAHKKDNTNGKDIVMVYPELVPIMDNNDDHHETHF